MNIDDLKIKVHGKFPYRNGWNNAQTDQILDYLHEQGLLMVWNYDMSAAPRDESYIGRIGEGEPFLCEYTVDGHVCVMQTEISKHRPTQWMRLPKGDA